MFQIDKNEILKLIFLSLSLSIISFAQELLGGTVSKLEIFFIFLTNLVLVVYLYWLQSRIKLLQRDLWLLLWINLWIIGNVNNIIEGYFFTDFVTEASLFFGVLLALVLEGLRSYVAVYLLPRGGISLKEKLLKRLENKSKIMLIFRVLGGSLVYFPIYFLFGGLISPFILEYYTRTGTGLKIPPFPTMIVVEILRGFLFVICLFPVLISVGKDKRNRAAALSGMLFIPGALLPLLNNQELPKEIIPYHLVEILADSIVYGYALSLILGKSEES